MPIETILTTLLALLIFSYFIGRKRSIAVSTVRKGQRNLHSLPSYYGYMVVIWAGIPALIILALWSSFDTSIVTSMTLSALPESMQMQSKDELGLIFNEIKNLASSGDIESETDSIRREAALNYQRLQSISSLAKTAVVFVIALMGILFSWRRISPEFRARNTVETVIRWSMIICASIAILSTVGIVFSVLFESIRFFESVPPSDFYNGQGIPSKHIAHLTERFYQVDQAYSRSTNGTGLGLAIVQHSVQRHGG